MYSLVLMTALASSGDASSFGKRMAGCHGCYAVVAYSCTGCSGSSCQGTVYPSACYGSCYGTSYSSACYGSCYGTSISTSCQGCTGCLGCNANWSPVPDMGAGHGAMLGSVPGYGWTMGGSACFGGMAGCYSLWQPIGGGYGYNIWVDPNKGPTIMPPRVGFLFHGGSFHGRIWHPFDGHSADYRGAGYYDYWLHRTIMPYAGGNGSGYVELNTKGGYDYTVIDKIYSAEAADDAVSYSKPKPELGKAGVTIELPENAVLIVEGQVIAGSGSIRTFQTPDLASNQNYIYEMTAEIDLHGQKRSETKKVIVRSHSSVTAKFEELIAAVQKEAKGTELVAK